MNIIEFIFGTLLAIIGAVTILGIMSIQYDYKKLEEENKKLKSKEGK